MSTDSPSVPPGGVPLWVNPPETRLPLTAQPLRFAVGAPGQRSTNSWKVWVRGNDTYVACRDNFRQIKVSLHASGIWRLGFTETLANAKPEMLPKGGDRVWKKWTPVLDEEHRTAIGFQFVAPLPALYVEAERRRSWPPSIVFVEPPADPTLMTVISVVVVLGRNPVRVTTGNGVPIAIVPLGDSRTVQLVATYEAAAPVVDVIKSTFQRTVDQIGGPRSLPPEGVFMVVGNRAKDIPWLSAVAFETRRAEESQPSVPADA